MIFIKQDHCGKKNTAMSLVSEVDVGGSTSVQLTDRDYRRKV